MKPTARLRLFLLGSTLLAAPSVHATRIYWDQNGVTSGVLDGTGAWLTTNQWWTGSANTTWTSGDDAVFGNGGAGAAVTLASPTTVGSLTLNYFTGTYTLGTAAQTITLNSGFTSNVGTGIVALVSPITLGGAQTWTNKSTGNVNVQSIINQNGNALTFDGSGNFNFDNNAAGISGAGGIIKNGTGQLIFSTTLAPTYTFTGDITLNGGYIGFQTSTFLGGRNTKITGGYLGGRFASGFTWTSGLGAGANQIQITGGTSGFSGEGGSSSAFQVGTALSTLKWGASGENGATGYFNPTVLLANGDARMNTNGKGSLNNGIDLNGTTRTITSLHTTDGAATSGFTISGAISNTAGTAAGLTKTGIGNLILAAANTYNGATTITSGGLNQANGGGAITLSGSGTINNTTALNLNGTGTLRLVNTAQVNRFADGAAITSNGGTIIYENTNTAAITYTETLGAVSLNSGNLDIVQTTNQSTSNGQTLTFGTSGSSNLTQSGTATVTFSAATTGPQATGNKNMIVVFGAGTTTAGQIIGPWATTGTAANAQTDYAVYNGNYIVPANIAGSAQSAWSTDYTTGTGTLNNTMANAAGAATTLTATRNISSLRANSSTASMTYDAATDIITVTGGHTYANGDVISFGGTAPGGTITGATYYVRDVSGSTFKVASSASGAALDLTGANVANITGGIRLSSGNNLGTTGILNAGGSGLAIGNSGTTNGVVTLPSTTAAALYITNGAAIDMAVPIANNTVTGVLTLVKNGSGTLRLNAVNTYTGDTAINAGTLQLGSNGIANSASLGSGNYAGNIFIGSGATLNVQTNANQTLSGTISGDGSLIKSYTGTLILSGNNTYTGKTSIVPVNTYGGGNSAGILSVSSFNSVVGGTASSSLGAPTTVANGTIDFGASGIQNNAQLTYTGGGETTDRVINFLFNGSNVARTIDTSGTANSLLKFTSTPTANATATNNIVLQGSSNGEFVGGLPFAFTNLTKSGAGTWTLGGAVGSTGVLTVSGGTLALQQRSSLQGGLETNWTAAKINVKSGATLALNVDSTEAAGLSATSLNTLLTNISAGVTTAALGLQGGSIIGLNTSTATGGTFTQGNAIANSTGSGGFNGAVGLTKLGIGTLVFDKTNTYTGTTLISAGTLQIGNGSTTGSLSTSSTITNNATLAFNRSDTVTQGTDFASAIGGTGGNVTQAGSGTLVLNGTNGYTGTTTVSAGKLTISSTGTINSTSGVSIAGGEFNYNSATALSQGVSFSGTGGKLSGSGTISPAVTVSSGNTLAPGNSIGTLSFGSGLTLAGTYSVELGTPNASPASGLSDRSVVTGGLTVGGNLTLVDNSGANGQGSMGAGAYRIATYTTTLNGTFAGVTNPLSSTLHEKVVYGPGSGGGSVDLNLYRLATGSTSAVALGKARVGDSLSGNLTTSNSAAADGFSENLNASVGSNAGDVNSSSGSVSGVIAGASSSTINVGLSTATSGAKSGSVLVSYASDGTGTSGYSTTSNGGQTVGVSGTVYDYAVTAFTQTGGDGALSGGGNSYTLDFGTGLALNTWYTANIQLANSVFMNALYQDDLGGSYSNIASGEFASGVEGTSFANLVAGTNNSFTITFYTGSAGTFGDTLTFSGLSQQSGLSDANLGDYNITLSAIAVPEPRAALLGGLGMLMLLRRRRN